MFRLEKVFQNDDKAFIIFTKLIQSLIIIFTYYIFSILINGNVYQLLEYNIFINSHYFLFYSLLTILYFIYSFTSKTKKNYDKSFLSFIKVDIINLLYISFFILILSSLFLDNFKLKFELFLSFFFVILNFYLSKIFFNLNYQKLIDKNIIQKNIMLIGKYEEIKKILSTDFDKIFIFKCCMITNLENHNLRILKSELKFPIFDTNEDVRIILEYHSLGQIWILNGDDQSKKDIFNNIIRFSVDTLNVNLDDKSGSKNDNLLANKYTYDFYEMSRFFGLNLFFKMLLDKFLSLIFLLLASPIIVVSMFAIYIEDGFPLIFSQNRTGWDGRRFRIFKLRTLRKETFDKTIQVSKNDKRVLKSGKIIRRYSIDELPQFVNVINGDMSIVGPRPHMVEHDIKYAQIFNNFLKRHKCNPGLTGWAQINGLRGATPDPNSMKKRMDYDLWYLNNWTIWLDIAIILRTFYAIFKFKGD
tara:strand:- start:10196 stop:11611 length:1416 start_codon:yes stop_codon:yes gene_type:complete